jgi:hypothetical protein
MGPSPARPVYTIGMPRPSRLVLLFAFALGACAKTSQSPPTTGAVIDSPVTSADPSAAPSATPASAADAQEVDAKYRACAAAADCVVVEPVGCCHNGRKVAVAVAQKDAYLGSFTCGEKRPICPMYRMLPDNRVATCESGACAMKAP